MSLFLTGTDTGVGKTYVAVQLLRLLRAASIRCVGMKPICCGDREDAQQLLAVSVEGPTIDQINPIWLRSPVAPSVASEIEHVEIDLEKIYQSFNALTAQFDIVIVEGVGGWLVPITGSLFVSDLAARFALPIVIVAENRLGCLNHVLLTVESARNRDVMIAGIVLNQPNSKSDLAQTTNEAELSRLLPDTLVIALKENGSELAANLGRLFAQNSRPELFKTFTQL